MEIHADMAKVLIAFGIYLSVVIGGVLLALSSLPSAEDYGDDVFYFDDSI